jgi:hypothetical protein
MTLSDLLVYVVVTALLSWGCGRALTRRPLPSLARPNYRGIKLNPVLGSVVAASVAWVIAWSLVARAVGDRWEPRLGQYVWMLAAGLLVVGAGFIDDVSSSPIRGLRGHLGSTLRGRPTTGTLKVAAGFAAGVLVVLGLPHRSTADAIGGVIIVAASANLWNDLDVAPGRAGKWFLIPAVVLPFVGSTSVPQVVLFVALFGEAAVLGMDLRERGMLGDAGSNFLGFVLGAALYGALEGLGLIVAAAVVVALNLVAETVGFSRIIDAALPLRWFDLLGTTPERRSFSANRAESE